MLMSTRNIIYSILITLLLMKVNNSYASYQEEYVDEYYHYLNYTNIKDPYENFNRTMFRLNHALDKFIALPIAHIYDTAIPKWGRDRVGNVLQNLSTPLTFINDTLQGNQDNASFVSFWRFIINSSFGIFGLFDIASNIGLPLHKKDFGQTMASYGLSEGNYLMLPILGPSTSRDFTGTIIDFMIDPVNHLMTNRQIQAKYIANTINLRSERKQLFKDIEKNSLDPYSNTRSMYIQYRRSITAIHKR